MDESVVQHLARDKDEKFIAWYLAAVIPYRDAPQPEPTMLLLSSQDVGLSEGYEPELHELKLESPQCLTLVHWCP